MTLIVLAAYFVAVPALVLGVIWTYYPRIGGPKS